MVKAKGTTYYWKDSWMDFFTFLCYSLKGKVLKEKEEPWSENPSDGKDYRRMDSRNKKKTPIFCGSRVKPFL